MRKGALAAALRSAARDGRWMDIVKDADAAKGEGFKAVVVNSGYYSSDNTIAIITCANPQIDREKNRAKVGWYGTNDGQRAHFVLCN